MLDEDVHHPVPSRALKRQMVLVIDRGSEFRPARPFPMKRSTTIDVGIEAHLAEAWAMMP